MTEYRSSRMDSTRSNEPEGEVKFDSGHIPHADPEPSETPNPTKVNVRAIITVFSDDSYPIRLSMPGVHQMRVLKAWPCAVYQILSYPLAPRNGLIQTFLQVLQGATTTLLTCNASIMPRL